MRADRSKPWFAPKRYGYGSGLPIAWQGWVVLLAYIGVCVGATPLMLLVVPNPSTAMTLAVGIIVAATIILFFICATKTRGGWRWRWGKGD